MAGAMAAIGMGGGKSGLTVLLVSNMRFRKVLILCPLRVVPVWPREFEKHSPVDVQIVALDDRHGSVADKTSAAKATLDWAAKYNRPAVIVINYESAWRDGFAAWSLTHQWDLVVLDESHRIKAAGSKISLFAARLGRKASHRLCLSGTPMAQSPLDVYGQYRFLDPAIFGTSHQTFLARYAITGGFNEKQVVGYKNTEELQQKFHSIAFRVGREVLDLPEAQHRTELCTLLPEAARVYRELERDFVSQVAADQITAANVLVKLLRLQQLTGGALKTDDGQVHRMDDQKLELLIDVLEDLDPDEPVVIFCRFHTDLDQVHDAARVLKRGVLELSGRVDQLAEWQAGAAPLLAVQIAAGGVGVDLTRAAYAIYWSLSSSLAEYDQSLARIHRPGQTRPVQYIHLVARGTVDERIRRALERRAEIVNALLDWRTEPTGKDHAA